MRSLSRMALPVALWVPALVMAGVLAGPTAAGATGPSPVISAFSADPAGPLSYTGGTVELSGAVVNAVSCTLSVAPPVAGSGLPATSACGSGSVSASVTLPENLTQRTARYSFELLAASSSRSVYRKVAVAVEPPPAPSVTLSASPTTAFGGLGGYTTLTATVENATTCTFGGSAALGYDVSGPINCSGGSASDPVDVPNNLHGYAKTWSATVSVVGLSGRVVRATIRLTVAPGSVTCRTFVASGCDDQYANLAGFDLSGDNFDFDNLNGADFYLTNLSGAGLYAATLTDVNFSYADLSGADMVGAAVANDTFDDTTCPDGTNSNDDNGNCDGHGI